MSFFDDIEKYFFTTCLYDVLGVPKDANDSQLKKAYYMLSLKHHPDRTANDDKEESKCKFQVLSRVYDILSNSEQRSVYDESGELFDDSEIRLHGRNWESYWRLLFKKITVQDIEDFEREYKESDKEKEDIKQNYMEHEGNMSKIMESIICIKYDEEERVRSIIQSFIDSEEVPEFEAYSRENKASKKRRMKRGEKEKREAEQHAKDIGIATNGSLEELILQRQGDRQKQWNNFFEDIEEKYKKKKVSKKGSKRK